MKDETKLFLGIIAATLIIIGGAVFFFGRLSSKPKAKVDSSLLVRSDSQKIASTSATVTLVEFSDYQCPACGAYYPLVKTLINEFKDNLIFVYRNFPLSQHQNAYLAALAAEAAGKQGKYWEMHDALFEKQKEWSESSKARDLFIGYAQNLKLDANSFIKDLDAADFKSTIDADVADGNALGITGTPTFFLDNEKIENPRSVSDFETLIKAAIAKAPKPTISKTESYHVHANIVVYINGKPIDFSTSKYQSTHDRELNPNIHFHDGKGDLIHIHKKGMKLSDLFSSFGLDFGQKKMTLFVNGQGNNELLSYEPQDLDRILLVDESVKNPQSLVTSVASDACIYSLKCPERGKPPTENCVGGLGTECSD